MSNQAYRETIKDLLGADHYHVSLLGTKWYSGKAMSILSDEHVIASILYEKNGVYHITCDVISAACPYMDLTFPNMEVAIKTLINTLKFLSSEVQIVEDIKELEDAAQYAELSSDYQYLINYLKANVGDIAEAMEDGE
jgi:hypothetical protein